MRDIPESMLFECTGCGGRFLDLDEKLYEVAEGGGPPKGLDWPSEHNALEEPQTPPEPADEEPEPPPPEPPAESRPAAAPTSRAASDVVDRDEHVVERANVDAAPVRLPTTSLPGIAALYQAEIEEAVSEVSGEYRESESVSRAEPAP